MILQETPTTLKCPALPAFDHSDLTAIIHAFAGAPVSILQQSWRTEAEADFAPGKVWSGWRDENLFFFAELNDTDIFTRATGPNERLWELGDTLEIFLRPVGQPAYTELHIAPNNQQLHLHIASTRVLERIRRTNSLDKAIVHPVGFESWTWLRPDVGHWYALAKIPVTAVRDTASLRGSAWSFSVCRYDYTRGRSEPVISSTSALTWPDFHRHSEWSIMLLL